MNTQVQVFNHEMFGIIRIVQVDGKEMFCLSDVCKALGLSIPARVKSRLEKRGITTMNTPTYNQYGTEILQSMNFIDEPNLYRCIFQSRKEEAERFQAWVFEEVLPSIRKDGGYIVAKADDTPEVIMARAILLADKTIKKQQEKIEMQSKQIADLERKTEYLRLIEATPGYVNINQIAQDYGWSAIRMNRKLHELGIQYFQGGQWILYAKYKDKGYVKSRTVVCEDGEARMHTKWSQRGRRFIYEELRKELILPMCELY